MSIKVKEQAPPEGKENNNRNKKKTVWPYEYLLDVKTNLQIKLRIRYMDVRAFDWLNGMEQDQ